MKKSPLDVIREDIKALSAYHVQDAANMIKLDAMENPFSLPQDILQAWLENAHSISVNRYPNPKADGIATRLRDYLNLDAQYGLLFGNGSDELIQMLMMACAKLDAKVLAVEPSFVMYRMLARICRLEYLPVDLKPDFSLDFGKLKTVILDQQPELIFIAQPNNPTGNLFDLTALCELMDLSEGIFVLDEAYTDFTDFDGLSLLSERENVVLMRTFSKTGLAGLRLGFLIGHVRLLSELDKVRLPYNINVLTQSLMQVVLDSLHLMKAQTHEIRRLRKTLMNALGKLPNLEVYPSEANFIVVRVNQGDASVIAEQLKQRGILIKVLHGSHALLENCLRLTVGSEKENKALLSALANLMV